ncbi:MAG TPA: hypothetical protein PKZ76_15090 [Xanthomonadaceae bacterium]|nr:hypothetical protein [Xanthomonadaceae bacterium]
MYSAILKRLLYSPLLLLPALWLQPDLRYTLDHLEGGQWEVHP